MYSALKWIVSYLDLCIVATLWAFGLTMVGTSDFTAAKWCFLLGNVILATRLILSPQIDHEGRRPTIIFIVFLVISIVSYAELDWIDGKRATAASNHPSPLQAVMIPAPVSGRSGGSHTGGPSTPNGILSSNLVPVAPAKPPAPKPKPDTPKKLESEPPPIQIAPSFGNIRERAILLSRQIMEDLYRHGWPLPGGQQPPRGLVIQQMPTTPKEAELWDHFRSGTFRFSSLQKVIAIRSAFAELHYHDDDLDELVESEKRNNAEYGEDFTRWPALFPQEIQGISEGLIRLANQIPAK